MVEINLCPNLRPTRFTEARSVSQLRTGHKSFRTWSEGAGPARLFWIIRPNGLDCDWGFGRRWGSAGSHNISFRRASIRSETKELSSSQCSDRQYSIVAYLAVRTRKD
jgi:hypothetical protein